MGSFRYVVPQEGRKSELEFDDLISIPTYGGMSVSLNCETWYSWVVMMETRQLNKDFITISLRGLSRDFTPNFPWN